MNGSKRAAGGGIAVTCMWANGLGRAAGKRFCASNGRRGSAARKTCGRVTARCERAIFANLGGTAEM